MRQAVAGHCRNYGLHPLGPALEGNAFTDKLLAKPLVPDALMHDAPREMVEWARAAPEADAHVPSPGCLRLVPEVDQADHAHEADDPACGSTLAIVPHDGARFGDPRVAQHLAQHMIVPEYHHAARGKRVGLSACMMQRKRYVQEEKLRKGSRRADGEVENTIEKLDELWPFMSGHALPAVLLQEWRHEERRDAAQGAIV